MNFTLNEETADLLAKAICKNLRKELIKLAKDIAYSQTEEYLNIKEAAAILGWSTSTLYKKKDKIGAYTKIGNQLRFPKSTLLQMIREGRLKKHKMI